MKRIHLRGGALSPAALLVIGLAAAVPVTLDAQAPARGDGTRVASAAVWAGGVDFTPEVRYREAVVTVSGNGEVFRRSVKAGDSLSIGVFDPEGQLLPDGVYKWEVELIPDARAAEKLKAAAALNGGVAPDAWRRESGTFAIHKGLVVAPDLVEAGPAPRAATAGAELPSALGASSAAREASGDDDSAVGSSKGVEAAMSAALASQPQAAAAQAPLAGAALERSDAAAQAMGKSAERAPAPENLSGEVEPPRRSVLEFDDPENGRVRSEQNR